MEFTFDKNYTNSLLHFSEMDNTTVSISNRSIMDNTTSLESNLQTYEIVITTFLTIAVVSSFILNFIIIVVFTRYKCLRTKHDMLLMNLAFTNLIITIGISFYSTYTLNPGDVFHLKFVCLNLFIFIFGGILTSLIVLLCLALERYLCIVHPRIHERIRVRHVIVCSILSYFMGLAYVAVPFHFKNNWERYHLCVADVFPFEFSIAEQIFGIVILIAIILINVVVFKTALSQFAKINTLLKSVRYFDKRKRVRQRGRAFVTVFLLSGISAICWIPLLVVYSLETDPDLNEDVRWVLTQLLYVPVSVNSSVTAVIIGYRNRHFRDAIRHLLCGRKHKHICNINNYEKR